MRKKVKIPIFDQTAFKLCFKLLDNADFDMMVNLNRFCSDSEVEHVLSEHVTVLNF